MLWKLKGGGLSTTPRRGAVPTDPTWRADERIWRILLEDGSYEGVEERPEGANPEVDGSPYSPWGRTYDHAHLYADGRFAGVHALGTHWEVNDLRLQCLSALSRGEELPVPRQEGFESSLQEAP